MFFGRLAGGALGVPQRGELRVRPVHQEREAGGRGGVLGVGLRDGAPAVAGDDGGGPGEFLQGVEVATAGVRRAGVAVQVPSRDVVRNERVEQRRDPLGVGMVEERLEARAPDELVAPVGMGEQEHGAAVADGVAVFADGIAEGPVRARQLDAGDCVRDRRGPAERVDVVARGQRPAGAARRPDQDRHPLQQVAIAQELRARLDAVVERAVDAGLAGAPHERAGVLHERGDVVEGDQVAGAGNRGVVGLWLHPDVSFQLGGPVACRMGAAAAKRSRPAR